MDSKDYAKSVREIAQAQGLLRAGDQLAELDSLGMLDFVIALEKALGVRVPNRVLRPETFGSIETVVAMLAGLDSAP